ncbi:MAG: tRNA (adenosine(37)-N6)-threonylcarbamoyltransferase complex dimerization subunit type 1 TsaB [Deltaproteobacteria bacterium]|nr:tRNA (adenosine(37)-N6)-threonylcarbamoyltransferase complex dimerization subunit type 1 TsaB [Deltaproteobacteria bacterium]
MGRTITTLALDTSSQSMSVALLRGDEVAVEASPDNAGHHAETIISMVDKVLKSSLSTLREVDLFAVTTGPGAFTGLRVGISTVKGFAYALDKPVVGVSALDALAHNTADAPTPSQVCPMIDAKHSLVYTALYRSCQGGVMGRITGETAIMPAEFLATLSGEVVFIGDGARIFESLIRGALSGRARFAPVDCDRIKAGTVGLIGLKKFYVGDIVDAMAMTPRYIRPSYAKPGRRSLQG